MLKYSGTSVRRFARDVRFALALLVLCCAPLSGDCTPHWAQGLFPADRLNASVYALCIYDDGSGPALYAGGDFSVPGAVSSYHIARWRNGTWEPLGSGIGDSLYVGTVYCLCVYDDGTGPALYAGGSFTTAGGAAASNIARWKNGAWQTLGSGTNGAVYSMCVYNDGGGSALYVGGAFTTAGGGSAKYIAKWAGGAWSAVGTGMSAAVRSLCVHNDGTGSALYAGGDFVTAGGASAKYIAKWKNGAWSGLGTGMNDSVCALCVHDDGTGPALYAGGRFSTAGGISARGIARWKDASWSALGSGMDGYYGRYVFSLCAYDDGAGPALYAGGYFTSAGGVSARSIARWKGGAWQAMGSGMDDHVQEYPTVDVLCAYDDGAGPALYAGGWFDTVGDASIWYIAKWRNESWQSLGVGMEGYVTALCVHGDGAGQALYAAGFFATAGGVATNKIARWNDGTWQPVGSGIGGFGAPSSLCSYDDGAGPALYASRGGAIRWKNGVWQRLGDGLFDMTYALCGYDDGTGPALYMGSEQWGPGGRNGIAMWKDGAWQPVGDGLNGGAWALCVHDDGTGPALYAGGGFTYAGGASASCVARWKNGVWEALGGGMGGTNSFVFCFCVYDDGTGSALYAGGRFTSAGGAAANNIARWKNGAWEAVGSGMDGTVASLCVWDDGTGPALYAGGQFTTAGSAGASRVARWKDGTWQALASGMGGSSPSVRSLCAYEDGAGPALYAGGSFTTAGGWPSGYVARWGCEPTPTPVADCPSARLLHDSSLVALTGPVSTAVFGDSFYAEDVGRTGGIRVDLPGHEIEPGEQVYVTGRLKTDANGERYILGFSAYELSPCSVDPLGVTLKALGGGSWGYDSATGAGQQGVTGGYGLNNIGLLVRCTGTFIPGGSSWFYIDDGSPCRVLCTVPQGVTINPAWQRISVAGISSLAAYGAGRDRLIRVRCQDDVVPY